MYEKEIKLNKNYFIKNYFISNIKKILIKKKMNNDYFLEISY